MSAMMMKFLVAIAAVLPQLLWATAPHTVAKNAEGILDFAPGQPSSSGSASGAQSTLMADLPAIEVGPGAEPTADGPTGAWAEVATSEGLDGVSALGAFVDEKGGITIAPAPGSGGGKFIAWGNFRDSLDELGWMSLAMHTSDSTDVDDGVKMYAAGVLEGYLSAERIRQFFHNSRGLLDMNPANKPRLPALQQGFDRMISGLASQSDDASSRAGNPLAAQARNIFLQSWGIRDGYATAVSKSMSLLQMDAPTLSMVDIFILNSDGVIDELLTAYGGQEQDEDILVQRTALRRSFLSKSKPKPRKKSIGHCTGFARLMDDNQEMFFGHTTWEPFSEMTRIWKVYDFPLQGSTTRKISFSSYPGCVSSTDDYYLMDSGLAITETTLNIPKQQRYSPAGTMPDFMRIMCANRVANNAQDWANSMTETATGTYSSQWMILDYNKFHKGQGLDAGAFYVLEQAPHVSHSEDMTDWLKEKGYWGSYDRAFFDDVRGLTGDSAMEANEPKPQSELYSKLDTPRAQILKRTAHNVVSLEAMRSEMTRNLGTSEPVDQPAFEVPRYTISARDDMKDSEHINPEGSPEGGVDAKITSSCLFQKLTAQAISSPSHTSLPPFRWTSGGSELWPGYPHEGLPDVADFDWVTVDGTNADTNMLRSVDAGGDCA